MDEASLALRRAGVENIFFLTVCIGRGGLDLRRKLDGTGG